MSDNFTVVKKGYDPAQVDRRIAELQKELREYREKDTSISNAILNAQIAADEILRKASVAADTIMHSARSVSARLNEKSANHVSAVMESVREQRARIKEFREDYAALISKYVLVLEDNDIDRADAKALELEAYLQQFLDRNLLPEDDA